MHDIVIRGGNLVDGSGGPARIADVAIDGDRIVDYRLRQPDQKRRAVEAFRSLNYRVVAAGDSYNDTTMLAAADSGFLFRAPANVIDEFPEFPAMTEYDDLLAHLTEAL